MMNNGQVSTVRSFNRTVTLRVGTFTDRFLGRDRPLSEARLIFEIGRQGTDVRDVRARLALDSGQLSRLLRSLEKQGLVAVTPLESDRRVRAVRLTPDGELELAELNRRGDQFAQSMLDPLSKAERERIVDAMSEVERLLDLSFARITVEDPSGHEAMRCLEQYCAELEERFEEGFDAAKSITADSRDLRSPRGAFLIARLDGKPVGCAAVKRVSPGIGSIKRMWVSVEARGIGIGRRLLQDLEREAAKMGFDLLRLETNKSLHEAHKLYSRNGYEEVKAFNDDPYADHWFEKTLGH